MNTQPLLVGVLVFVSISVLLLVPLYLRSRALAAEPRQPRPRLRDQVTCLPLVIGMAVLCTLGCCIVPLALISDNQIATTESKPVIQAVTPDLAGQKVVAEGFISQKNPVKSSELVAYARFTKSTRRTRSRLYDKATPPLRVELSGGMAWIENPANPAAADYDIAGQPIDSGHRSLNARGLVRGERVTVFGTVDSGPLGLYIDASSIFSGSRGEYLSNVKSNRMPTPLIIAMFVLGLGICAYGIVPALVRRRHPG